jgi:hypothetical protein
MGSLVYKHIFFEFNCILIRTYKYEYLYCFNFERNIDLILQTRLKDNCIWMNILDLFELVYQKDKHIYFFNYSKQRFLDNNGLSFNKFLSNYYKQFLHHMTCIYYFSRKLAFILDKLHKFCLLHYNIDFFHNLGIIFLIDSNTLELYTKHIYFHYHKFILDINIYLTFR